MLCNKIIAFSSLFLLLQLSGCQEEDMDPIEEPKPYTISVEHFFVVDNYDPAAGGCGFVIYSEIQLGNDITNFKPIDLPAELQSGLSKYEGQFLVLPNRFKCQVPNPITGSTLFDMPMVFVLWYNKL